MSRWFRVYSTLVDDPKFIKLGPDLRSALLMMWCVAGANDGRLPPLEDVAIKFRLSEARTAKLLDELRHCGWIDDDDTGSAPHNWNARQFKSDADPTAASRSRKYRDGKRDDTDASRVTERDGHASVTGAVTPPREQIQRTDTEADPETEKPAASAAGARKRATRLSADWWPSIDDVNYAIGKGLTEQRISTESEKFRNYWTAKGGKEAAKIDWHATWQNWILNAIERTGGPVNGQRQQSLGDIARDLADEVRERERQAGFGGPLDHVRGG